jgi:hypothetical protein
MRVILSLTHRWLTEASIHGWKNHGGNPCEFEVSVLSTEEGLDEFEVLSPRCRGGAIFVLECLVVKL